MPPGTGTRTTELLRLHPSGVRDQQSTIISDQSLLQADCFGGIFVFGEVGDESFCDGLADSVDLGNVTTTLHSDADVDAGEGILADDENGLVDFVTEDFGLDELDGGAVDADEASALTSVGDSGSGLVAGEARNRLEADSTGWRWRLSRSLPSFSRRFEQRW